MRACYIVNPTSGKGHGRQAWERIQPIAAEYGEVAVAYSGAKGEATELARQAAERGADLVVAVGGDGTLHEVVNGLAGSTSCLGLIPAGTGNDFARAVGVPADVEQAVRLVYEGIQHKIDLMKARGGPFIINVAGVGFDAEVADRVNRYPKTLGGTIPYLLGVMSTLIQYRPVEIEIELDGTILRRTSLLTALGNAQSFGGGMRITPEALVNDGLIDVCIGGDLQLGELFRLLPKLYKGGHRGQPKVEFHRARHVEIRATSRVAVQADGEILPGLPLTVDLMPAAIPFMGPAVAAGIAPVQPV